MKKTIRELIQELGIKEYDIHFWNTYSNKIGELPCEYVRNEMALNPVNMIVDTWHYNFDKKRYVIYVNANSNTHYIALMYKLIGEYTQFQIEERAQ